METEFPLSGARFVAGPVLPAARHSGACVALDGRVMYFGGAGAMLTHGGSAFSST